MKGKLFSIPGKMRRDARVFMFDGIMDPYSELLNRSREFYALKSAASLAGWDQETMMPPAGAEGRARTMEALSRVLHQRLTSPELGDLLDQCAGVPPGDAEAALVRELRRDRGRAAKIPERLAGELARTTTLAQRAWVEARPRNNVAAFNPWLEKVLALRREEAECLGYDESPYDALLDAYEPGARASRLKQVLGELERGVVALLDRLRGGVRRWPTLPRGPFPLDAQRRFNGRILRDMGFNLNAGRLDESAHPFTESLFPTDVRLTTRYSETDLLSGVFSTLHEGGHGLYEQGFPSEHYGTPLAEAVSLGVHESQSRLWENQVGRSEAFWERYYPDLREVFADRLGRMEAAEFLGAVNRVEPSLIRVEADEVTYNLHIIVRFNLELAMFEGGLKVDDLEEAWNEAMAGTVGVVPDCPANGYLQDVHWSAGLIGYFPTYSLGNIYAAQLFRRMREDIPGLDDAVRSGEFAPLLGWLRDRIHRHGRRFAGEDLIRRATGEGMNPVHLVEYLGDKYSRLFDLPPAG